MKTVRSFLSYSVVMIIEVRVGVECMNMLFEGLTGTKDE